MDVMLLIQSKALEVLQVFKLPTNVFDLSKSSYVETAESLLPAMVHWKSLWVNLKQKLVSQNIPNTISLFYVCNMEIIVEVNLIKVTKQSLEHVM